MLVFYKLFLTTICRHRGSLRSHYLFHISWGDHRTSYESRDNMEEDGKSAWRSAQKAESDNEGADPESSPVHVVPTAANDNRMVRESPVYDNVIPLSCNNTPTTFVSHHVTPTSSRKKHMVHGVFRYACLAPALLMVILLTCVTLQSVLIFLRVTGKSREDTRDDRVTGNSSHLPGSNQTQQGIRIEDTKDDRVTGNSSHLPVSDQTQPGRSPRCPDLWITINDKCYFFSEIQKSRIDSARDCEERGSSLATVKEETIRRLVTSTGKEFWVGLSQYNKHGGRWTGRWTDGSTENVSEGTGSCAKLGSHLTLENCYTELHFICERDAV